LDLPAKEDAALEILMHRYDLSFIALTYGSQGSLMISRHERVRCPGMPMTVKDTVGAGDSFAAAMTLGLLNGLPLDTVNRLAGTVASYVCSQSGAAPELPSRLISEFNKTVSVSIKDITEASNPTKKTSAV
jgi:fructokinase